MGTTDKASALLVLDALSEAGTDWALLHGLEALRGDRLSDVDVVAGIPRPDAASSVVTALDRRGLRPLLVWPYDVGSAAVFIVDATLRAGVQLDVTIDPDGRGKYGIRTGAALSARVCAGGTATVSAVDSWLYQLRKRDVKAQQTRRAALLAAPPDEPAVVQRRAQELFAPDHARVMTDLLSGRDGSPRVHGRARSEVRRWARRARYPCGVWLELRGRDGDHDARDLCDRLKPIVPHACVVTTRTWQWWRRTPLPGPRADVRWRPGVVISHGAVARGATVSLAATGDADTTADAFTAAASRRAGRQLRRWLAETTR